MSMFTRCVWLVGCAGLVAGCAGSSTDDLRAWMVEQRNAVKPKVENIPEPSRFVPQAYSSEGALSPFSNDKLSAMLRKESGGPPSATALIQPELSRRKEPLEFTPLDNMSMVGLLDKRGQKVGLVKVDQLLYQVKTGNYLGQNYGRITRITETEITLREIVQDAAGEWIERPASLQLLEGKSK